MNISCDFHRSTKTAIILLNHNDVYFRRIDSDHPNNQDNDVCAGHYFVFLSQQAQ